MTLVEKFGKFKEALSRQDFRKADRLMAEVHILSSTFKALYSTS
jgi:hypothetical protein